MILEPKYELIRKLASEFAKKELTREILDEVEETGIFPQYILDKMAKAGFFGIKIPKSLGGQGADTLAYMIVMEEMCRISAVASLYISSANSLSSGPLLTSGTKEQLDKYLTPIVTGKSKLCFALTEPGAGSDAASIQTYAQKCEGGYILNGRKCFITAAPLSDFAVIYAKTDKTAGVKGISAFIVDMKSEGVSCGNPERKMGLIGCATSDIILENVFVPAENLLGREGKGFVNAMKTLDVGRLGVAAQSLGVAQGCLDDSVKYVKERKQFGKHLKNFQTIRFTIADMATKIQAARELIYNAAVLIDKGIPCTSQCSMAKYFASEMCNEIAAKAVQLHGGYGYMKDYPIERRYRDCRVFTIYEGTSQVQQMVIANDILK